MIKRLAKIESASLNIKDYGVLTFYMIVAYEDGYNQSICGICLDTYDEQTHERVGTAFGCELIRRLLLELYVNDFSEMAGKHIWVHGDGDGFSFEAKGISALYVDNQKSEPVIFSDVLAEFK